MGRKKICLFWNGKINISIKIINNPTNKTAVRNQRTAGQWCWSYTSASANGSGTLKKHKTCGILNGPANACHLTCHLYNVPWHNVSGFDSLDTLPVLAVHFPHLWLVFLESFNGIFCISLLNNKKVEGGRIMSNRAHSVDQQNRMLKINIFQQLTSHCRCDQN